MRGATGIHGGRVLRTSLVLALLTLAPVRADELVAPGRGDDGAAPASLVVAGAPEAHVVRGSGGLEVEGRFRVAASPGVAWAVLTDYDDLGRFVSSLRESRVTERSGDRVIVEQTALGRLFLFTRRLHTRLEVREDPPRAIRFEDVLHADFAHYRGEWRIEDRGGAVEVTYRVDAAPRTSIPEFVARGMIERMTRELLAQVEREIAGRAALAAREP